MQETPAAADPSDTEAAERIPEIKSQAVDEYLGPTRCPPGQINKEPWNDASDVVHGDSAKSMDGAAPLLLGRERYAADQKDESRTDAWFVLGAWDRDRIRLPSRAERLQRPAGQILLQLA
ncbi:unnamed protein product [Symbiodinium sp. CCMP2592]|nr:unnamed protein product [Symbiodinium sp. CCMP2592]